MAALGSGAHRAIIEQVIAHYRGDARVLAVAVFGSVSTHLRNAKLQLSAVLAPEEEIPGLYLHPDHRRRLRRDPVRSDLNV